MLVALHGLSGGSHELYLRHVIAPLVKSGGDGDGGWEACVVNSRGCANSKITTGVLYNARATWDVRQAVGWLRKTFPNRPLFGIGFSLGANILTNVRIKMRRVVGENMNLSGGTVSPSYSMKPCSLLSLFYSILVKKARIAPLKPP